MAPMYVRKSETAKDITSLKYIFTHSKIAYSSLLFLTKDT
jgi:hypothetical protein